MFSKAKKSDRIESEQREQYEYARQRIKQKKTLFRHFITYLAGSVLLIIINPILHYGDDFFFPGWFIWAILLWTFIFLVHALNVFVINSFMGREWEDRQMEKLKTKQAQKIAELQRKVDNDLPLPDVRTENYKKQLDNPYTS